MKERWNLILLLAPFAVMLFIMVKTRPEYIDCIQASPEQQSDLIQWKQPEIAELEQQLFESEEPPYDIPLELDAEAIGRVESCVDAVELDEDEVQILEKLASAEAGTEDIYGMALVMRVVINRMMDDRFPDTVKEVVMQQVHGVWQFSSVGNGSYDKAAVTETCIRAAELVRSGWDGTQGATYYCTKQASQRWHAEHLEFQFQHGNQYFYKEKEETK